jgi:hypothetical protein
VPFVKRLNTPESERALARLAAVADEVARLEQKLAEKTAQRDALVVETSRLGATRRAVASAARLSAARVQQLVGR